MFLCFISSHDEGAWKHLHTTIFLNEKPQSDKIDCTVPLNKDYTVIHIHTAHIRLSQRYNE